MTIDRAKDAYEEGKKAALRGESLSQYEPSYHRQKALWMQFQLGYLDTIRDMRRAQKEKRNVR